VNTRSWLIALLLAALALRLGWCFSRAVDEAAMARSLPDQYEYLQAGRSWLKGLGFSFFDRRFEQRVYAFRTPGYPLFVAACAGNVRAIQVGQCIIDASTVLAVFMLARRWVDQRASLLAAAVVAANPFLVFFCSLVLSETLFVALLIWGMALLARSKFFRPFRALDAPDELPHGLRPGLLSFAASRISSGWFMLGASLLALSVLVRPSAMLLPIVMTGGAIAANGGTIRRMAFGAVAAAGVTVIVLLPWALRNRTVLHEWVWTSTNTGFTLYDGFNPAADGSSDQSFVKAMPELGTMSEIGRSKFLSQRALTWLRQNPAEGLMLAATKLQRMWSPIPLSDEYGGRRLYVLAAGAYAVPLFVLAIAGLLTRKLSATAKVFLLLPAIYFSVSHALSVGSLRYRIPAEPPLAILAAAVVSRRVSIHDAQAKLPAPSEM